jgi:hypothetical protein
MASAAGAPGQAEGAIALGKVKRLNKAQVREACFDTCLSWKAGPCKRIGQRRARCKGTVVFSMYEEATRCRITNRWKQDSGRPKIYEISKRCAPA